MALPPPLRKTLQLLTSDQAFLRLMEQFETIVAKVLSLAMVTVIVVSVWDLIVVLLNDLPSEATAAGFFKTTLVDVFGVFLSILIALEVLENITAYLRRHVVQLELVVATSLTAVARKIIIFDINKDTAGADLIGLAIAILALSISYWIVRAPKRTPPRE
ncbi:MAG: phosphate-starvation-inducible PsiE family protein [Prochlorothrix sp.]|nr:phosphate-starvation-inducible PsiE family protein [Prochlorothrix sp.]